MSQYLDHTEKYIKTADLAHRKKLGQYFTPRHIQDRLFSYLPEFGQGHLILDPAVGTGEFLYNAQQRYPKAKTEGWEIDPKVAKITANAFPKSKILTTNSLLQDFEEKYDLVIGNPPYFEEKPSPDIKAKYQPIISGRYNIYAAFIYLGLQLLKDGGYLAFVLPPSMNNGAYFQKLRHYISEVAEIKKIDILDKTNYFDSAQQLTMILVLQKKKKPKPNYIFKINGIKIFSPHAPVLNKQLRNATNLRELGYEVKTGRIVWNQNRDLLSENPKDVTLIWSHNITENGITLHTKPKKKQFIKHPSPDVGPAIVVNRITGAAHKVSIRSALIPKGMKFLAENHVNVIFPPKNPQLFNSMREVTLEEIHAQLRDRATSELFSLITGNTQISKTELELLLPIKK